MFDYLVPGLGWYLLFAVACSAVIYYFCVTAPLVDEDERIISE